MSSECCSVPVPDPPVRECPSCGNPGKPVGNETLLSLLREEVRHRVQGDGFLFCATRVCDIVYFRSVTGPRFARTDLEGPVWQKKDDPTCPVCYCFNHTADSIRDEIRQTGSSEVQAGITRMVRAGLCACESKNPQGTCCLGNVGVVVQREMALLAGDASGAASSSSAPVTPETVAGPAEQTPGPLCCRESALSLADDLHLPPVAERPHSSWLMGGSMAAALAASACCWLPLALGGAGISAAGAGAVFEGWRSALLAAGFYVVYFREQTCGPGSACASRGPGARGLGRIGFWAAAVLVAAAASFPNYASHLTGNSVFSAPEVFQGRQVTLSVSGMTCEACTGHVRSALLKVPGVLEATVDFAGKSARISAATTDPVPSQEDLVGAVTKAGYSAQVRPGTSVQTADPCCGL